MTSAFIPEQVDTISIRDKNLVTARLKDGQGYVTLLSLSDAFGVTRSSLTQRLKRNSYYDPYTCRIMIDTKGGPQEQLCINASAVPLFLSGASLDAIKDPEKRLQLEVFINECQDVLAEHFGTSEKGEMTFLRQTVSRLMIEREYENQAAQESVDGVLPADVRAPKSYVDQKLAEIQKAHEEKLEEVRTAFVDLRKAVRANTQEPRVERLTPEEVHQVNASVRHLGFLLQERGVLNPFPTIYFNLFRMAGVGATERIKRTDFEMSMDWIERQIAIIGAIKQLPKEDQDNILKLLG